MYTEMQRFSFWDFYFVSFQLLRFASKTHRISFCDIWDNFSIASCLTEVKAKLRNDFQTRHGFVGIVS